MTTFRALQRTEEIGEEIGEHRMKAIKLHPHAEPILGLSPEEREAVEKTLAAMGRVIAKAIEAVKRAWQIIVDAVKKIMELFNAPIKVRLHPTAQPIEVPFLTWLSLELAEP